MCYKDMDLDPTCCLPFLKILPPLLPETNTKSSPRTGHPTLLVNQRHEAARDLLKLCRESPSFKNLSEMQV